MKIFYFKNGSPEWLKVRGRYITGTAVPTLFKMNPYEKVEDLINSKFHGVEKKIDDNKYMRRGRGMESAHFVWLNEMGIKAQDAAGFLEVKYVVHDNNLLASSLDGEIYDDAGGKTLEVKSVGASKWSKIHRPSEKRAYFIQLYTQILCTNFNSGLLSIAQAELPNNMLVYELTRDKKIDKIILDTVERFYKEKDSFEVNEDDRKELIKLMGKNITLVKETDYL